jgi:hypothetical protein
MNFITSLPPAWKYAFASVTGASHLASNAPCQDSSACQTFPLADGSEALVAVVSDGAGTASRADAGASLVCSSFLEKSKQLFASGGTIHDLSESFARDWLIEVRRNIRALAGADRVEPNDFACTFVAAAIGENESTFLHLGDGAIVIARRGGAPTDYRCISWPQQGEYVNSTNLVTHEDALENISLCYEAGVDEVALFSDGLQHLVLDYENQLAHAPFFNSVFSWLRATRESDAGNLSRSLIAFLNSDKVNERTDDDKTLVLSTRRAPTAGSGL